MKKKIISLIIIIVLMISSFLLGMSFYNKYDVNRDGNVDIKDLLKLQKYLIERGS